MLIEQFCRDQFALRKQFTVTLVVKLAGSKHSHKDEVATYDLFADRQECFTAEQILNETLVVFFKNRDSFFCFRFLSKQQVFANNNKRVGGARKSRQYNNLFTRRRKHKFSYLF